MDLRLLLVKSVTLLFRESQLPHRDDTSIGLLRTVIDMVKLPETGIGINTERETLLSLRDTVIEMCNNPPDHEYLRSELLQRLKLNCGDDEKLFDILEQGIIDDLTESQVKRFIVNTRRSITNHFREQKIDEVLSAAQYQFRYKREKIKDVSQFIVETMAQLEPLQSFSGNKDPAVMSDIDIGNEESMNQVFKEAKNIDNGTGILRVGWQDMNEALQGGIRPTDLVIINGLQHKYKTGFNLSLFAHIPLYNVPVLIDPTKKPLIVRIAFEDEPVADLQFLYQMLKHDETRAYVNIKDISEEEMSRYVKDRLQVNGFHIKMIRVDPTQWSYVNVCNKITELEAQGYEIKALFLDQLSMIPTTGCNCTGPTGTDMRDLFRRIKNFTTPKRIPVVTPHQLSTEAKQLIRGGMPEDQFVKQIAEKGYTSGSKQLDQDVTLEIYIHLFKHNKEAYLSVQRGKHRIPTILPDDKKYFLLRFPKGMPIPSDLNGEKMSFRKLSEATAHSNDSFLHF